MKIPALLKPRPALKKQSPIELILKDLNLQMQSYLDALKTASAK